MYKFWINKNDSTLPPVFEQVYECDEVEFRKIKENEALALKFLRLEEECENFEMSRNKLIGVYGQYVDPDSLSTRVCRQITDEVENLLIRLNVFVNHLVFLVKSIDLTTGTSIQGKMHIEYERVRSLILAKAFRSYVEYVDSLPVMFRISEKDQYQSFYLQLQSDSFLENVESQKCSLLSSQALAIIKQDDDIDVVEELLSACAVVLDISISKEVRNLFIEKTSECISELSRFFSEIIPRNDILYYALEDCDIPKTSFRIGRAHLQQLAFRARELEKATFWKIDRCLG